MLFSFTTLTILLVSLIGARAIVAAHLQGIAYLITNHRQVGLIIYSLLFLPGIIIHEMSHFFMAGLLGVRTGEITIFPSGKTESGQQRLGSVQIANTDMIRNSLIGIAPLLVGSISIIALVKWQFPKLLGTLVNASGVPLPYGILNRLIIEGKSILAQPLNFMWIYLIFAIANTMFVSESDRRSWPAMAILLAIMGAIIAWIGVSPSLLSLAGGTIQVGISILNAAFIITLIVDVFMTTVILGLEVIVSKLLKKQISYHPNL